MPHPDDDELDVETDDERMTGCDFSLDHYRYILDVALENDYLFASFDGEVPEAERYIYLRHDVDIFTSNALTLGQLEAEKGVTASYFFQPNTPFYNLFETATQDLVWQLTEYGHTVGLHIDASLLRKPSTDLEDVKRLAEELHRLMSEFLPVARVFSIHRPPPFLLGRSFTGFTSVYEPRFFSEIRYISDSRKQWRDRCVCTLLEAQAVPRLQLLTHPCWWNKEDLSFEALAAKVLDEHRNVAFGYLTRNITPFREVLSWAE